MGKKMSTEHGGSGPGRQVGVNTGVQKCHKHLGPGHHRHLSKGSGLAQGEKHLCLGVKG